MIAHIGEQTRSHRRCFTARCRRLEPRITHDQARGNSSRPLKNPLSSRGTSLKRRRPHSAERCGLILYSRNACTLNGSDRGEVGSYIACHSVSSVSPSPLATKSNLHESKQM